MPRPEAHTSAAMWGSWALAVSLLTACGIDVPPSTVNDAIMLADLTYLLRTPDGQGWQPEDETTVIANTIRSSDQLAGTFEQATQNCYFYQGVDRWTSRKGVSPLTLSSSQQQITATFVRDRYQVNDLRRSSAFAARDQLVVSHHHSGLRVEVDAPPTSNPREVLGTAKGPSTEFRAPDGQFSELLVFFIAEQWGNGQSGGLCRFHHDDMRKQGRYRTLPLLSDPMQLLSSERGLTPAVFMVAYYNVVSAAGFFDDTIPIQAGRMFAVDAVQLRQVPRN